MPFSVFMCKYTTRCICELFIILTYTYVCTFTKPFWHPFDLAQDPFCKSTACLATELDFHTHHFLSVSHCPLPILPKDTRQDLKRYWMPDSVCKECSECGTKFNIIVRRHHCRICGRIFCNACCSLTIPGMKLRPDLQVLYCTCVCVCVCVHDRACVHSARAYTSTHRIFDS